MSTDKHPADVLADKLEQQFPIGTAQGYLDGEAATMLRRIPALEAERDASKKALALVQQHHTTAWNRGHEAGMRAARDQIAKARDAVKADAWGNSQLTEALMAAEEERDALRAALSEADRLLDHCDEPTEWRERWAHLLAGTAPQAAQPVAHVSECEACFTPDVCQLRGTCDHYSAERLRIAAPHAAHPLTDEQIRAERNRIGAAHGFMDGVRFAERAHGIGKEGGAA